MERMPVYRNIDRPLLLGGFSPVEIVFLMLFFVGSLELLGLIGFHQGWSFGVVAVLALAFQLLRRTFGKLFVIRLIRFAGLPTTLYRHLCEREADRREI